MEPVSLNQTSYVRISKELREALHRNQTIDNGTAYVSAIHVNSGEIVAFWQTQLKAWAMTQPDLNDKYRNLRITGSFEKSPEFTELIKDFQRRHGLEVDGIIGPRTFRAFATRYYFNVNHGETDLRNLGRDGFEEFVIALITHEEYLRVINQKRVALLSHYGISAQLPKGISAKEVLNDPAKLQRFREILASYSGGNPPISAERFLELCAQYDFDPTLALAQAIGESHIGTRGRAAFTNNIFNVGNVDSGENRFFRSFEDGMIAYLELMTSRYASTAEEFIGRDGRRIDGRGRYATDPNYSEKIFALVHRIRQHLDPSTTFSREAVASQFEMLNRNTLLVNGVNFVISTPQDLPYINPRLFHDISLAAKAAGIHEIYVSCLITGHRYYTTAGNVSRHMSGNAIDISKLNGLSVSGGQGKILANALTLNLANMGYSRNREGSANPMAFLWECPEHYGHIHVSNTIREEQLARQYLERKAA